MSAAGYYSHGKRGSFDGAPIWRPKWWDELGNDKEFREATKPRTAFKAKYYEGGHRMTIDGVPVRVAASVKDWAPWMKRALGKQGQTKKEGEELQAQMEILWPAYGREKALERKSGYATCLQCREEYYAYETANHVAGECWHCKQNERAAA